MGSERSVEVIYPDSLILQVTLKSIYLTLGKWGY
jgi:hypothetical protein